MRPVCSSHLLIHLRPPPPSTAVAPMSSTNSGWLIVPSFVCPATTTHHQHSHYPVLFYNANNLSPALCPATTRTTTTLCVVHQGIPQQSRQFMRKLPLSLCVCLYFMGDKEEEVEEDKTAKKKKNLQSTK